METSFQAEKSDNFDFKKAVIEQLSSVHQKLDELISSSSKTDIKIERIKSELMGMKLGMGDGLEKMAAQWLRALLATHGINDPEIELNKKIKDIDGVVHPNKEVEIDVFCLKHPYIVETTSHVKYSEFSKIVNFVKKRNFVNQIYGKQFKGIFATLEFSEDIAEKCQKYLDENDILIVDASKEFKIK